MGEHILNNESIYCSDTGVRDIPLKADYVMLTIDHVGVVNVKVNVLL